MFNKTIPGIPGLWVLSVWTTIQESRKLARQPLSYKMNIWAFGAARKCLVKKKNPLTSERMVCFLELRVYKLHLLSLFREKCSLSSFSSAINQKPQWHSERKSGTAQPCCTSSEWKQILCLCFHTFVCAVSLSVCHQHRFITWNVFISKTHCMIQEVHCSKAVRKKMGSC